jgi:hypothetical protein
VKCKHKSYWWMRVDETIDGPTRIKCPEDEATFRICCECRGYVPLGPATDTPETAIEVRAAEIAADASVRLPKCSLDQPFEERCERCGWEGLLMRAAEPTANWHAGYLARCIAEHAEEGKS